MRALAVPVPFHAVLFDSVDSTNEEAKRQGDKGAPHGTLIVAAEQTAGRGRRGREWVSKRGNLHCSFLLRTGKPLDQAAQVSFAAGIALVEALRELCPSLPAGCKWPNDVLSEGRKLSGMLLEAAPDGSYIVLGIGVNVAHAPENVMYPTLALSQAGYVEGPERLAETLCACLGPWLSVWQKEGFKALRQPWLDRAYGLGEPITVRLADRALEGRFAGLDANGALLLEGADGICQPILAGDVFFPGHSQVVTKGT